MCLLGRVEEIDSLLPRVRLLDLIKAERYRGCERVLHVAESIPSHFVTMDLKNKKNANKKNASKSVENENESLSIHKQNQSIDMTVNKKLDLLLEVVRGLDTKIQEQDVQIQKQEERVSLHDVSALPSAQSSPK